MDQSVVAGGVGGVAIVITTKIIQKFHESFTAEGRVQALHTLFLAVETRHNHFVHKLLPQIEPPYRNDEEFQGVENYTKIIAVYVSGPLRPGVRLQRSLHSEGSRKDNLMGEICNSGLYRYSPTFKKEEIEEIARRLRRVDEDTWVCLFPVVVTVV